MCFSIYIIYQYHIWTVDIGVDNSNCHKNLADVPVGLDCPTLIIGIITFEVTEHI